MGTEIERKFLLASDAWRSSVERSISMVQVYLAYTPQSQVRLRRTGDKAYLTVKGAKTGISRAEIETEVPPSFADEILEAGLYALSPVVKTRHLVPVAGHVFEIDEYAEANAGLVVAELELPAEDTPHPRPDWLGEQISDDPRYANLALAESPFTTWR
ncbi:CYTH domain-containing protein [Hamadaea sp. NPDC051192]|uniref:CYTH domain-containing protein n=1 Tax=Hamadaea sp. NPDC051192 TaxID=3154940 RepID=UPI0034379B80